MDEVINDTAVVDTPQTVEEVNEVIHRDDTAVEDMTDDELDTFLDGTEDDSSDDGDSDDAVADTVDDDLESLYATQNTSDGKLAEPILVKVNGEVYSMDSIDELRNMAERGHSVTRKFQKLADDRRQLEAQLKELGQEPQVQDVTADEVNSVAEGILSSSYAESFKSDMSKLPQDVRSELGSNAQMLSGLGGDYESGLAQKIMPKVTRLMNVQGMSFLDAYKQAGSALQQQTQATESKMQVLKSQPKQTIQKPSNMSVDGMSDKEFDKYFQNM